MAALAAGALRQQRRHQAGHQPRQSEVRPATSSPSPESTAADATSSLEQADISDEGQGSGSSVKTSQTL